VVLGLVLGIVCGLALPEYSAQLKPLGDGFIKLIKMLIGLIVFAWWSAVSAVPAT
jgi:aerobic C4-dicarboxylate transport protein